MDPLSPAQTRAFSRFIETSNPQFTRETLIEICISAHEEEHPPKLTDDQLSHLFRLLRFLEKLN
jgi:hypothetical protein